LIKYQTRLGVYNGSHLEESAIKAQGTWLIRGGKRHLGNLLPFVPERVKKEG
jgi:hypothetical protein